MCKCGSGLKEGTCVPNYLPVDTMCDLVSFAALDACEIAKCSAEGLCEKENAEYQTPCYYGDIISCQNAGYCNAGVCTPVGCFDPPSDGCTEAGAACDKDGTGGTCCPFSEFVPTLVCDVDVAPGGTCPASN